MPKTFKHKVCVNVPGDSMNTGVASHEDLAKAILLAAEIIGFRDYARVSSSDGFYLCTIEGTSSRFGQTNLPMQIEVHQHTKGVWSVPDWHLINGCVHAS